MRYNPTQIKFNLDLISDSDFSSDRNLASSDVNTNGNSLRNEKATRKGIALSERLLSELVASRQYSRLLTEKELKRNYCYDIFIIGPMQ